MELLNTISSLQLLTKTLTYFLNLKYLKIKKSTYRYDWKFQISQKITNDKFIHHIACVMSNW